MRLYALLVSSMFLVACGEASSPSPDAGAPSPAAPAVASDAVGQTLTNPIQNAAGAEIGRARLTEGPQGLLIRLEFNAGALTPGWHGVHFHAVGTCEDGAAGFTASGAHVGHAEGAHGLLNPAGPEPGDLPSIFAPRAGAFGAELYTTALGLNATGTRAQIADADGSAFVIHANHDDQSTQPIGGAGARVACVAFNAG